MLLLLLLLVSLLVVVNGVKKKGEYPPLPQTNLLFIMFDDLRPELSVYGKKHMITPNFERLAKRSVVFDIALTQVAVCNPSRDSLLTGIRPDSMGHYNFQQSYLPHKLFPEHLIAAGYKTAGYGKIRHWDGKDKSIWTEDQFDGPIQKNMNDKNGKFMGWYEYQDYEWRSMKSSVMPDKQKKLDTYPDHVLATRAVEQIRKFAANPKEYWMTAVGFKMPHTALHVPHTYWEKYNNTRDVWKKAIKAERSYPKDAPPVGFRCCAESQWRFMNDEGAATSLSSEPLGDYNATLSEEMYVESMQGYAAAITYVDEQLGRILDVLDELNLWDSLTVVLTADHGMHNGEKAIWEKWTLFDEATRVPLIIAHPNSPYKSSHSFDPVELLDIFPTILDLVASPHIRHTQPSKKTSFATFGFFNESEEAKKKKEDIEYTRKLNEPSGKSLAPLVVGHRYTLFSQSGVHGHAAGGHKKHSREHHAGKIPQAAFAVSQSIRCAKKTQALTDMRLSLNEIPFQPISGSSSALPRKMPIDAPTVRGKYYKVWNDCDLNADVSTINEEVSLMGYSARSAYFRYTLWIHFDRTKRLPEWWRGNSLIFDEELYDHRGEELGGLSHYELENIAHIPGFEEILEQQRQTLLEWIRLQVFKFGNDVDYINQQNLYFSQREVNATILVTAANGVAPTNVRALLSNTDMTTTSA